MTLKFKYLCTDCGSEYSNSEIMYLCPACNALNAGEIPPKGVLKTIYDYDNLKILISVLLRKVVLYL
ncbi:MAG: hypothetical protein IPH57_15760 [Saprospiraceae bacterium]|nr:hypothetical protein [Saprospiraceae bacterium]